MNIDLEKSYQQIKMFNEISGNLEGNLIDKINNQLDFIYEEVLEVIEAFDDKDPVNLLKESLDVWVTVVGLLQKLEAAGFDVKGAMEKVDENNLSKFPDVCGFHYDTNYSLEYNENFKRWVIKDSNGKVKKPNYYQKVDVSEQVPKKFFD